MQLDAVGDRSLHRLPQPRTRSRSARFAHRCVPLTLMTIFGLTSGVWLSVEVLIPQVAYAYTNRATITLNREPDESYQTLLRRAEALARAATQQAFDRDLLVSDVLVTIVAETETGLVAPVLALEVNRTEWRRLPDPQRWSTYFENARVLLRLDQPAAASSGEVQTTSQPATPPPLSVPNVPTVEAAPIVSPMRSP